MISSDRTPTTAWSKPIGHIPALDGLRGIAILMVIPHNAGYGPDHSSGLPWVEAILANGGWIGVQLFFVLSGFLITGNLISSRGNADYYSNFFARRALRILPLYYVCLLLGFVILPALGLPFASSVEVRQDQIWFWIFLSNWVIPLGISSGQFSHFWSLAVEEQFYLLWPFVIKGMGSNRVAVTCALIAGAALVARAVMVISGATPDMIYEFTIARMDALSLGALVAAITSCTQLHAFHKGIQRYATPVSILLFLVCALLTNLFERDARMTQIPGQTLLAISFSLLIVGVIADTTRADQFVARLLSAGPLRQIGKYSYAMYVFHFPLSLQLARHEPWFASEFGSLGFTFWTMTIIGGSYAMAWCSYHLLEKHFLRLKSRFHPRRESP